MTGPSPSLLSAHTVTSYAWMVWGQEIVSFDPQLYPTEVPFRPRVRLSATRYADVHWKSVMGGHGSSRLELSAQFPSEGLYVVEGEHWRSVLEGLYREWAPSPTGDLRR